MNDWADLLLAAALVALACGYVLLGVHLERRRARREAEAARSREFWAQMGDVLRASRRRQRVRPKVDPRIQRRRYAP